MAHTVVDLTEAVERRAARRQDRIAELVSALADVEADEARAALGPPTATSRPGAAGDDALATVAQALVRLRNRPAQPSSVTSSR